MEKPRSPTFTRIAWVTDENGFPHVDHDRLKAHVDAVRHKPICHVCGHANVPDLRSYIAGLRMCADTEACQERYAALPEPTLAEPQAERQAA